MLDPEEWSPIRGFRQYSVSTWGRVVTHHRDEELRPRPSGWGYLQVCLSRQGERKMKYVHRLVAEAFIPGEDDGLEVNHIDGDKLYNNVINLEWVTKRENNKHAYDTGLRKLRGVPVRIVETGERFPNLTLCAERLGMSTPGVKYLVRYGTKNRSGLSVVYDC